MDAPHVSRRERDQSTRSHKPKDRTGSQKAGPAINIPHRDHMNVYPWTSPEAPMPDMLSCVSGDYPESILPLDFSNQDMQPSARADLGHPLLQASYTYDQSLGPEPRGTSSCASSYSSGGFRHELPYRGMDPDSRLCCYTPEGEDLYSPSSYPSDNIAFTSPVTDDMNAFDAIGSQSLCQSGSSTGYSNHSNSWSSRDCMTLSDDISISGSHPMSVSSSRYGCSPASQSHSSQLDTPLSMVMLDDPAWPHTDSGLGDKGDFSTHGYPDAMTLPPASYPLDQRFENYLAGPQDALTPLTSTIKPTHQISRPGIPDAEMWQPPQCDAMDQSYRGLPYPYSNSSRRSSGGESTANARKDPLYNAMPGSDKLFHCPFESDGCTHSPEKLKCNYE